MIPTTQNKGTAGKVYYAVDKQVLRKLDPYSTTSQATHRPFSRLEIEITVIVHGGRYFRGRVSNFNQPEARKQCVLAPDWLRIVTLPRKYRTLFEELKFHTPMYRT